MSSQLEDVFTPSVPLSKPELFVGREESLSKLEDIIKETGSVPTIVGDRGVGKTSLVQHFLTATRASVVTCSSNSTFDDLARRVLRGLGIDVYIKEISTEVDGEGRVRGGFFPFWNFVKLESEASIRGKKITHRLNLGSQTITKDILFDVLCSFQTDFSIVIDEFDRLGLKNRDTLVALGDLIKDLADNHKEHRARLVVCGVASNAKELFRGHPSIPRQIREVYLRPLTKKDLEKFLQTAMSLVDFEFDRTVIESIVFESDGFPYAVHLIALESCRAARRRGSRYVTMQDFEEGQETAISYAFRDYLDKFKESIETLSLTELEVIRYINLIKYRQLSKADLESLVHKDLKDNKTSLTLQDFQASWERLVNHSRFIYSHPARNDRYLFTDPLLRPFLRLQFGYPTHRRPAKKSDRGQLTLFD